MIQWRRKIDIEPAIFVFKDKRDSQSSLWTQKVVIYKTRHAVPRAQDQYLFGSSIFLITSPAPPPNCH